MKYRDVSPFFIAINKEYQWAIEMFCDHGANTETLNSEGLTPIIYAAQQAKDKICMYLSLRTDDVD